MLLFVLTQKVSVLLVYTLFIRLHAHAQIDVHPSFSVDCMHSEFGVFHVILPFCDTVVVQNVE